MTGSMPTGNTRSDTMSCTEAVTMLKKIRKKLKAQQPLTLLEKEFLSENGWILKLAASRNIIIDNMGYNR